MTTTGKRLRELREKRGQSQEDIAKLLGIGRTTYLKYETGENKPTRKLKELSALFDVTADYIMGLSDNPHNSINEEGPKLTAEDITLLDAYHAVSDRDKNIIDTYLLGRSPQSNDWQNMALEIDADNDTRNSESKELLENYWQLDDKARDTVKSMIEISLRNKE